MTVKENIISSLSFSESISSVVLSVSCVSSSSVVSMYPGGPVAEAPQAQ